ncbi:NUDIX hydrolase [Vibrio hannami]|uniref:NUDIX hydrolase n=1 Tax=Vibrio hannami TaxID=2717094 RepID=UPI00240F3106|nr:NUDIX hydrolase [Vibrio hannami]MDG3085339.1 NUDIX hydrolase [Vibrio hannami]
MKNLSMAVVIRNGLILIQERFRRSKGMVIEFPGGSVDIGESRFEAAIRELREETGLTSVKHFDCVTLTNEFGGDIHYIVLNLLDNSEPKVVDPIRKQTFYWLKSDNIPLNDFYEADREFITLHLPKLLE